MHLLHELADAATCAGREKARAFSCATGILLFYLLSCLPVDVIPREQSRDRMACSDSLLVDQSAWSGGMTLSLIDDEYRR